MDAPTVIACAGRSQPLPRGSMVEVDLDPAARLEAQTGALPGRVDLLLAIELLQDARVHTGGGGAEDDEHEKIALAPSQRRVVVDHHPRLGGELQPRLAV